MAELVARSAEKQAPLTEAAAYRDADAFYKSRRRRRSKGLGTGPRTKTSVLSRDSRKAVKLRGLAQVERVVRKPR